jgi:hypothetical protein
MRWVGGEEIFTIKPGVDSRSLHFAIHPLAGMGGFGRDDSSLENKKVAHRSAPLMYFVRLGLLQPELAEG